MYSDNKSMTSDHQNASHSDHPDNSNSPQQSDLRLPEPAVDTSHCTVLPCPTSQSNSRNSPGPTSTAGKRKSARNAIRDGIFARELVIPEIGERREDFEMFANGYFNYFVPLDLAEEGAVRDFVEYRWQLERVRKAEEQTRCDRLEAFQLEYELERADELNKLIVRFLDCVEDYASGVATEVGALPADLEEVRDKLISTSEGNGFLLNLLERLTTRYVLSLNETALLHVISGSAHPFHVSCRIDQLTSANHSLECGIEPSEHVAKREAKSEEEYSTIKAGEGHSEPGPTLVDMDLRKETQVALINSVAQYLKERRDKLKVIEAARKSEQLSLIVLDPSGTDRFSRAGTRAERGMHKALMAFWAIRDNAPISVS